MARPADRVRARTGDATQRRLDMRTEKRLRRLAHGDPNGVARRLHALDREWDTDRTIELEAACTGLACVAIASRTSGPWRVLPAFVAGMLATHAVSGCYPLLPILRRLGLRSSREIARERAALKALRGDFAVAGGHA
jgi:hypothetical protein